MIRMLAMFCGKFVYVFDILSFLGRFCFEKGGVLGDVVFFLQFVSKIVYMSSSKVVISLVVESLRINDVVKMGERSERSSVFVSYHDGVSLTRGS